MARSTYLGTANDVMLLVTRTTGAARVATAGGTLRFYADEAKTTQYMDLLVDGVAVTEVVVPAGTVIPPAVELPDGVNDGAWVEFIRPGETEDTPEFVMPRFTASDVPTPTPASIGALPDTTTAADIGGETPTGAQAKADAAQAAAVAAAATDAAAKASAAETAAKAASVPLAQKGAASGVAALGADSRVAEANLPTNLAATALSATFANKVNVADLPTPFYAGHRGGLNVYPESTLEGYRGLQAARPGTLIELDVNLLVDGAGAISHDGTVDRATNGTGNVSDFSSLSWQNLVTDIGPLDMLGGDYAAPLYTQVLDEFGGRTVLLPEAKVIGSGQYMADLAVQRGLTQSMIVSSFIESELTPCKAADIPVMFLRADGVHTGMVDPTGVAYFGFDQAVATDAAITALVAAGFKPVAYTVNRRTDRDRLLALGVAGFISDDPVYLAGNTLPTLAADPFASQTFYHGHLASGVERGQFIAPDRLSLGVLSGKTYMLQGWMHKKVAALGGTFTINYKATFDTVSANADGVFFVFGQSTDFNYKDDGNAVGNCWSFMLKKDGTGALYKVTNGSASIAGFAGSAVAVTAGTTVPLRVEVTPTTVKVTRVDTGGTYTASVASHGRGPYCYFGLHSDGTTRISISDVTIS